MKKRMMWLAGQILRIGSVIGGLFLIIIVFGMGPLKAISEISQIENVWAAMGPTLLQVSIMTWGIVYSFILMGKLYQVGVALISISKEKEK